MFSYSDGTTQALGTCLRDFRNKPYPVRAKITYYKKTLTVRDKRERLHTNTCSLMRNRRKAAFNCSTDFFFSQIMINNGFTPDKEDYEFCTKVDNMIIPSEGFFGISAATGGLAGINLLLSLFFSVGFYSQLRQVDMIQLTIHFNKDLWVKENPCRDSVWCIGKLYYFRVVIIEAFLVFPNLTPASCLLTFLLVVLLCFNPIQKI